MRRRGEEKETEEDWKWHHGVLEEKNLQEAAIREQELKIREQELKLKEDIEKQRIEYMMAMMQ